MKISRDQSSAIIVGPNSKILVLTVVKIILKTQHFVVNAVQNLIFK
jgi:hypothetical protein